MWKRFFDSAPQWAPVIVRMGLGIMILPHGSQKLLGWFGGYGFAGTMGYFTETMGIPWLLALGVILIEFFGGLGLIAGLATRFWGLSVAGVLFVGALMSHVQHGFFMNWAGNQAGEGIEFHILAVAMGLAVSLTGSGRLGVDRWLAAKLER